MEIRPVDAWGGVVKCLKNKKIAVLAEKTRGFVEFCFTSAEHSR